MEEWAFIGFGLGGVVGAFAGGALMWWRRPQIHTNVLHEVERAPLFHKHEWHISGKRAGRVRMRCVVPGCKNERNQDGPE